MNVDGPNWFCCAFTYFCKVISFTAVVTRFTTGWVLALRIASVDHHSIGMILRIFPLAALFQERNAFVSASFLLLFLFCTLIAELHLSSCLLSEGWLLVIGWFRLSLG
jgi:hypothetical protein